MNITRRHALKTIGGFGASLGVSGCSLPITAFCPADPSISNASTPLTIDVHAHVFNGSDLQIEGFFSKILASDSKYAAIYRDAGEILAALGRDFAPTAAAELVALQSIEPSLRECDSNNVAATVNAERDAGYQRAYDALQEARGRLGRRGYRGSVLGQRIDQLQPTYETYKTYKARRSYLSATPASITADGAIDFIIRNFQYRYVNVYDYLREYSQGAARKIDLIVAHLVDYDWPIGNGVPTPTSLTDQVRVMERITQLTGGRVQCFAPYDPFKELANGTSLSFVQDAILRHGFIGVKLYPPMGFAPLGNDTLSPNFWDGSPLPPTFPRENLGFRLDKALKALYSWCEANGVPIMAHTSESNGPSKPFEQLTYATYWAKVVQAYPDLRIDLGHFGVTDIKYYTQPDQLSRLMKDSPFLYADSAYFAEVLSQQPQLETYLKHLMKNSPGTGPAAVAQRLMYGTDWEMVVLAGTKTENYLRRFEAMYAKFDRDPHLGANGTLSDRFFGTNAAIFLGLGKGQPNRQRLDQYYAMSSSPAWMAKVDGTPAVTS